MLLLTATTDKLQVITSAAVTVDVHASFMDMTTADPPVVKGSTSSKQNTAITTATTTDVVAAPAASTTRNVKALHVRNKHATTPVDVTVQYNQNATLFELHKATLLAGEMLEYVEGIGFFTVQTVRKAMFNRRVATDVVNATTSFVDITGLTCPVQSGKHYNFQAHLYHISNATTTGAQFGINGPTMTALQLTEIDVTLNSVTVPTFAASSVAALNTAIIAETTGAATIALGIVSGWINPSAEGTFAMRCASEVAVASGLTVKAGSFLQLWEADA